MAMPQRDNVIEEIKRLDALLGVSMGSDPVDTQTMVFACVLRMPPPIF